MNREMFKLHVSVPLTIREQLYYHRELNNVDELITKLLSEYYGVAYEGTEGKTEK